MNIINEVLTFKHLYILKSLLLYQNQDFIVLIVIRLLVVLYNNFTNNIR